jgi:hypothetical protein
MTVKTATRLKEINFILIVMAIFLNYSYDNIWTGFLLATTGILYFVLIVYIIIAESQQNKKNNDTAK